MPYIYMMSKGNIFDLMNIHKIDLFIEKKIRKHGSLWPALKCFYNIGVFILKLPTVLLPLIYHQKYHFRNSVAIDIISKCNLKCFNCQASCRQAPSDECISIEQVNRFIDDAIQLNYKWESLDLYGGEPTLHPQLGEILKIIIKYKNFNPDCRMQILSNGTGFHVKQVLSELPEWVQRPLWNEDKGFNFERAKHREKFYSYNIAPIDLKQYKFYKDFSKGCQVIKYCHGLALSRYGFYPCTPGASVDRIFGFDIGIKKLSDVTEKTLRKQMQILCRYCGFFHEPHRMVRKEEISITWEKAYKAYKERASILSLY